MDLVTQEQVEYFLYVVATFADKTKSQELGNVQEDTEAAHAQSGAFASDAVSVSSRHTRPLTAAQEGELRERRVLKAIQDAYGWAEYIERVRFVVFCVLPLCD